MDNLFWDELNKCIKPYLKQAVTKRVKSNIIYSLHGLTENIKPAKRKITELEDFLSDLLFNYGELVESLERFGIIATLIKEYPKRPSWEKAKLTKTVYLRYHYESFLNEAYLYRERMRQLLGDIKKKCRKKSLFNEVELIDGIIKDFLDSLDNVTTVRGHHVHQRRFKNKKIEQLSGLELVSGISSYFDNLRDSEYKQLRIKLNKEIIDFSKDLEKLQNLTLNKIVRLTFGTLKDKYK